MAKVTIPKDAYAIVTGRNGTFRLQSVQFNVVPIQGAAIEFVGERGHVLNAGAYAIPTTALVQLCIDFIGEHGYDVSIRNTQPAPTLTVEACKQFLEKRNFRVLDQFESQPDTVEFVNDSTGESYENEDDAIECAEEGERIMRVEQFWTQIHPAEDEE